jgi:type II secretory pathway pseudopilin PulG
VADGNRDESSAAATVDLGPGGGARDPQPPPAMPSAFDRAAERFERVGEIGRGGMGRVDDAFDRALGRPVAIKHMLAAGAVDLARFEREARITARLEHPGIVPIHDAGRSPDGTPYYVMRRIDGRPLAELVVEKAQLAARLALIPHVLTACEAAAYAHARSIVHRDIKPTNILIGPFGESLLIDWGLAREIGETHVDAALPPSDPRLTRVGTVAGTPGFMAPEQARGESVDARADVFALGATLFYVIAGKPPYASDSATEMIGLAGAGRPPDWRAMPPQVPPDLRAIVQKAMASQSAARYADAGALAADLRQFLVGNLVGAYRYGKRARLARFVRRHRAAVAVAVISALVLAVVATLSVRRIVAERDDANDARAVAESRQHEAMAAADRLLVQRAQEQLDIDPTLAIQLLRRLPPDSPLWPQAASIAQAAALLGIPFGFQGSENDAIVMAPDGRHAATIDVLTGDLAIIDLTARTRRSLGRVPEGHTAVWLDAGRHLGVATSNELVDLDIATGVTGRRRQIPADHNAVVVARDGAIWVRVQDRVYEAGPLDASFALVRDEPLELGDDTELVGMQGGPHVVLGGRTHALTIDFAYHGFVSVPGGIIAVGASHFAAWRVRGDEVTSLGAWALETPVYGEVVGDAAYIATVNGLVRADEHGVRRLNREVCTFPARAAVAERAAYACHDGSIVIIEPAGTWTIPARRLAYNMLALSPDGRFLVARTRNGTLLAWDLQTFAPRLHELDHGEQFVAATDDTVWTLKGSIELVGYDVTTWKSHSLGEQLALREAFPDATGTLLMLEVLRPDAQGTAVDELIAADPASGHAFAELGPMDVEQVGDDGVYVGRHDGAIVRWTNQGGFAARVLLALGAPVVNVSEHDGVVAAILDDRELVRLEIATGAVARTRLPSDADRLAVGADGRVWASRDRTLWSWDGRAAPHALELPAKITELFASRDHVVVGTAGSLMLPESEPPQTLSFGAAGDFSGSRTSNWLAAPTSNGIAVLDESAGSAIYLPLETPPHMVWMTRRGLVLATDWSRDGGALVSQYAFTVPSQPAALQRWLADVTNARAVAGSDAMVWP